ncbi:MAG: biopolymer transporter ExbD [Verrucomicrobiae bacterium]|nr:biopolymer transporter ExbD [Verrucomicrobiae bacterium]
MRIKAPPEPEMGFQIAPMVDIVFSLMLFFMCSASTVKPEAQLGVTLPGTGEAAAAPELEVYIGIQQDGSVTLNETPIGTMADERLPELRAKLQSWTKRFGDKIPVFVQPHPGVPHQRVVDVLDACAASGVKNLSFSEVQ